MIFDYPSTPHVRQHGPQGYAKYQYYKPWLRDEFTFRCAYCLTRETWYPNGEASFSTDHFAPQSVATNLILSYDNLIYACLRRNSWKQDEAVLAPCQQTMSAQLRVHADGSIEALTPQAREHMLILGLDDPMLIRFREQRMRLVAKLSALQDAESQHLLEQLLGYPSDLPNLNAMRPPDGNSRPDGAVHCCFQRRRAGELPKTY